MLTLAYDSSVVDSRLPGPRRGWATLTSFALQATAVAVVLIIPLLQPSLLPSMDLTPHVVPVFLPHAEVPNVQQRGSSDPSVLAVAHAFTAPWLVPKYTNTSPDPGPATEPEGACVGCIPGSGPSSSLPIGTYIALGPALPPALAAKPLRVSRMMDGYLIRRVQPDYPVLAKQTGVHGTVEITAVISKDGTIENLQVLKGHPMLIHAAMDAVRQWRYRPYILNGDPIEVSTMITVTFSLGGN